MNTKPSWWPTKPNFNVLISPLPKGSARNEKCKCGSGLKAKRCVACGHGLPTLHDLSYTEYETQVKTAIKSKTDKYICIDTRLLYQYFSTKFITPIEAADLMIELDEYHNSEEYKALQEKYNENKSRQDRRLGQVAAILACTLLYG